MTPILDLPGIGPHLATKLAEIGISTAEQFAATSSKTLLEVPGISTRRVESLLEAARRATTDAPKEFPKSPTALVPAVASKASGDARDKVEDTTIADEILVPVAPEKVAKRTDKKKEAKGKVSKKAKAKIRALKKEVKARQSKVAHQSKKLKSAKKAKKAAAKKKAAVKKGKSRKKD